MLCEARSSGRVCMRVVVHFRCYLRRAKRARSRREMQFPLDLISLQITISICKRRSRMMYFARRRFFREKPSPSLLSRVAGRDVVSRISIFLASLPDFSTIDANSIGGHERADVPRRWRRARGERAEVTGREEARRGERKRGGNARERSGSTQ